MSTNLDAIVAIAILIFWVILPIASASRIGVRRGYRHTWLFGLVGGWVGVLVAWVVLRERTSASEPVVDGETHTPFSFDPFVPSGRRPAPRRGREPLGRLFPGLPRGARVVLDWVLTVAGAILIVLALKQWVVNPYRIPSSSMEPALHCARPAPGCEASISDRVLADRLIYDFESPQRGQIVVFNTPPTAKAACGEGGTFVKRLIGLPGDTVHEDKHGYVWIRSPGAKTFFKLKEPYLTTQARLADVTLGTHLDKTWHVPKGDYFFMGDNRGESCDSRDWGPVPRSDLIGEVFFIYWPPDRIGFK